MKRAERELMPVGSVVEGEEEDEEGEGGEEDTRQVGEPLPATTVEGRATSQENVLRRETLKAEAEAEVEVKVEGDEAGVEVGVAEVAEVALVNVEKERLLYPRVSYRSK